MLNVSRYCTFILCFTSYTFGWLSDVIHLLPHEVALSKKYDFKHIYKMGEELRLAGFHVESLSFFKIAFKKEPKNKEALLELANTYWLLGNVELGALGWASYAYQAKKKVSPHLWRGESIQGKTIVASLNWGLGDTFLLIRYLQLLKDQGATVVFKAPRVLHKILSLCPYIDKIVESEKAVYFDYSTSLLALPYYCKSSLSNLPCSIPYLYVDQTLIEEWKERLSQDSNLKIGICWKAAARAQHPAMQYRSIALKELAPLLTIPNVSIYSLQRQEESEEIPSFEYKDRLYTFGPDFDKTHGSFMDTAAVMKNLDLVITVDTSLCHLAGGLGVRVWTLLPHICDCRSFMYRPDNPWYPTMRLFRQAKLGEWAPVIAQVADKVRLLALAKSAVKIEELKSNAASKG